MSADSVANKLRWGTQRHLLLSVYNSGSGMTDEEVGKASGLYAKRACYHKRCSELRDLGVICDTGETRTSEHGNKVMVCVITPAGISALAQQGEGK